jgi:hypothetical protein
VATRELTVEWEDDGEPDYVDGEEAGYLKLVTGLQNLGLTITDEREL